MADGYSIPTLPLTTSYPGVAARFDEFCNGDVVAHQLNSDVVKCGQDAIVAKLDSRDAMDTLRETLKSECALQKSIAEVGFAVRENKFEIKALECVIGHLIKNDGERTRDVTRAGFQRLDDQLISKLQLQLSLATKCGCGCGSVTLPTDGPGNS